MLLGVGPVVLLPFVRDWAGVFSVAFVHVLGTEQSQLSRRIANLVVDTHFAHLLAFLRHVDDEAIYDAARTAGLIINRLDCGGDDLKIVVCLEGLVHLRLVPQLFKQGSHNTEVRRDLREHLVGRAVTDGNGKKTVCPHYRASSHSFGPCGILDGLAQVQRRGSRAAFSGCESDLARPSAVPTP